MSEAHRIAEYCAGKSLPTQRNYRVPCPAHGGKNNNLSISEGRNGKTVFACHSHGCSFEQIRDAIPEGLWNESVGFVMNESGWNSLRHLASKSKPAPTLKKKGDEVAATKKFAEEMWNASTYSPTTDHAYAVHKKFGLCAHVREAVMPRDYAETLKKGDRVLVIKMTDEDGCFVGVQLINEEGKKIFAGNAGMLICSYTEVLDNTVQFHVVEGYATATAVPRMYPDQNNIAVVAFSKGQLEKVARLIKDRFGASTKVVVHHEHENIDLWDVVNIPEKRERYRELLKRYWGEKAA